MDGGQNDLTGSPTLFREPVADAWTLPREGLAAAAGLFGAVAASSCCIVPLLLFMLGISGAWIGNLAALEPYQPYFLGMTAAFLGVGYYLVYRRPKVVACEDGQACARPLPNRIVKVALWSATAIAGAVILFPYIAPALLGV